MADIPDVGIIVINDERYLHANDLVEYFNAKAQENYDFDVEAYEMFDNAAAEVIELVTK